MAKSLFLMVFITLAWLLHPADFLGATDTVVLAGLDSTSDVETETEKLPFSEIMEPVETPKDEVAVSENFNQSSTAASVTKSTPVVQPAINSAPKPSTQTVTKPAVKSAAPANSITIAGNTVRIVSVNDIVESGDHANKIMNLLYGHNSGNVFGGISSLGVGSTFVVRNNGQETAYRVGRKVYYDKDNSTKKGALRRPGSSKNYMNNIARAYDYDAGVSYDLAIMTCAGRSLGGGDATQRLVLYANAL